MRYTEAVQPLETGGMAETRVMTIAATGKAFRNLMDGLYSRKIEAFCREILTNAYDSHCAAGTPDRLFDVWVPTIFDKRLRIRDYGVGMSHDMVMDEYSVLFHSTKDQSDDEVGMFGLGKGSPFAYTDGFSLRCWDGAECRVYSIYLGAAGVPQVSLASRVPSDEPRGVEVGIPVAKEDFEKVNDALARVCVAFAHPPKLPRHVEERIRFEHSLSGDGWAVGKSRALVNGVWARQGCVLYPIPTHEVAETIDGWNKDHDTSCVVLDFAVGELEITPSRETLSFTDETKANVAKRLTKFVQEIGEKISEHFADCRTNWDIAVRYGELSDVGIPPKLLRATPQAKIHAGVNETFHKILYQPRRRKWAWRWTLVELGHSNSSGARHYEIGDIDYSVTNAADSYYIRRFSLPTSEKPLNGEFVVDSGTSNAKIAAWLRKKGKKRAFVLRRGNSFTKSDVYEHRDEKGELLWSKRHVDLGEDDLLKLRPIQDLGNPEFVKASLMPPPPKPVREKLPAEDGMEYDPERGIFFPVDKKRLREMINTHRFLFYSKQRKEILEPSALCKAGEWKGTMSLGMPLSDLMLTLKSVLGHHPKIALVKVTPSMTYDDVRGYRLVEPVEKVLLEQAPDDLWDNAVTEILWQKLSLRSYLKKSSVLIDLFKGSVNPNVRRVGRLMEAKLTYESERDENGSFYRDQQASLVRGLITRSDAVRRRFVDEARKRDFRAPIFESMEWGSRCWVSRRWRAFIKRMSDFSREMKPEELRFYYRAMESAEHEYQRKGGVICQEMLRIP